MYLAEQEITEANLKGLERVLHQRHGEVKLIRVHRSQNALIVKTTSDEAPDIRRKSGKLRIGRIHLESVLSSGAIGKLKKRALEERK